MILLLIRELEKIDVNSIELSCVESIDLNFGFLSFIGSVLIGLLN
jgi:hypothetical protein